MVNTELLWETTEENAMVNFNHVSVTVEGDVSVTGKNLTWKSVNHFVDPEPVTGAARRHGQQKMNAGISGEHETLEVFVKAGVEPENVFLASKIVLPGVGDLEVSDGLIVHGDTIFMLQIKTRIIPNSGNRDENWLRDKMRDSRWKAFTQALTSLKAIQGNDGIWFENLTGTRKFIKADEYKWVSLIVLAYNELIPASPFRYATVEAKEKIPNVTITLKELRDLSKILGDHNLLMGYLEEVSHQKVDCVGYEFLRLFNMVDTGKIVPLGVNVFTTT